MSEPILIAGGGIGGLSAALGLGLKGIPVRVLEGAPEFGAIGYGIQLGPNVFPMFERLGITEAVLKKSILPDACVSWMRSPATRLSACRPATLYARFTHPYIVIHRIDLHNALLDACRKSRRSIWCLRRRSRFEDHGSGVGLHTADGRRFEGSALIGADGLRSIVRASIIADGEPKPNGYVAHRTIIPMQELPKGVMTNVVVLWAGPGFHIVHYPLRDHSLFNIVAVFKTSTYDQKGDLAAYRAEIDRTYANAHPAMKGLLELLDLERRWTIADRDPVRHWARGRVAVLGDAAHPTLQTFAQGACMAIEDGVTLSECIAQSREDIPAALQQFSRARYLRTGRLQLESRRVWQDYHCGGVEREVMMQSYREMSEADVYRCLSWIYDGIDLPGGGQSAKLKRAAG